MDHNEINKSKKETLKSYTDYSGLKGTQAKIEQYKNLLDFLIKDCKDLIIEGIHSNAPYEDPEEELERWLDDLNTGRLGYTRVTVKSYLSCMVMIMDSSFQMSLNHFMKK